MSLSLDIQHKKLLKQREDIEHDIWKNRQKLQKLKTQKITIEITLEQAEQLRAALSDADAEAENGGDPPPLEAQVLGQGDAAVVDDLDTSFEALCQAGIDEAETYDALVQQRYKDGPPQKGHTIKQRLGRPEADEWKRFIPLAKKVDQDGNAAEVLIGLDGGDAAWFSKDQLDTEVLQIINDEHPIFARKANAPRYCFKKAKGSNAHQKFLIEFEFDIQWLDNSKQPINKKVTVWIAKVDIPNLELEREAPTSTRCQLS